MRKQPPKSFHLKEMAVHAKMIYNPSVWQQFPSILAYPLRGHALFLFIISSVSLWFLSLNPIMGRYALIILTSWTLKYAYGVLEHTILGHATPPMFTFNMWNFANQRPLKQILYLLFVLGTYSWLHHIIGNFAFVFLAIAILAAPASAVIIAHQNSFLNALNPIKLMLLVKHIGSAYILICLLFSILIVLLLIIISSIISSLQVFNQVIPNPGWNVSFIALLFCFIGFVYLLLMTFHLLGFVVYHRRDSLGLDVYFSPEKEAEAAAKAQAKQFETILDEVYWLSRQADRTQEAIDMLFLKLPELGDTLDTHDKLFARISLWENKGIVLAQAQHYVSLLLKQKRFSQAVTICQTCLELNIDLTPKNTSQILPLASTAYQEKRYSLALHWVQDFSTHHPNHPDIIAIKLLTAKLLGDGFKRYQEAKTIMAQLLEHQEHSLYPDIKKYATFLIKYQESQNH